MRKPKLPTYTIAKVRRETNYKDEDWIIYGTYENERTGERYVREVGRLCYERPNGTMGQRGYEPAKWWYKKVKKKEWVGDDKYERTFKVRSITPPKKGRDSVYVSIRGDESFYVKGNAEIVGWNTEQQRIHKYDWKEFIATVTLFEEEDNKYWAAEESAEKNPQGGPGESKTQLRM